MTYIGFVSYVFHRLSGLTNSIGQQLQAVEDSLRTARFTEDAAALSILTKRAAFLRLTSQAYISLCRTCWVCFLLPLAIGTFQIILSYSPFDFVDPYTWILSDFVDFFFLTHLLYIFRIRNLEKYIDELAPTSASPAGNDIELHDRRGTSFIESEGSIVSMSAVHPVNIDPAHQPEKPKVSTLSNIVLVSTVGGENQQLAIADHYTKAALGEPRTPRRP